MIMQMRQIVMMISARRRDDDTKTIFINVTVVQNQVRVGIVRHPCMYTMNTNMITNGCMMCTQMPKQMKTLTDGLNWFVFCCLLLS